MSSPAVAPTETLRLRTRARRSLFWIIAAVAAIVVAVISVVASSSLSGDEDRLSLANAGPSGGMAVAEVLREQGVDVVAAASLDEATAASDAARAAGDGVTVLFADPYGFLDVTARGDVAGLGDDLVLVEPGGQDLGTLAPGIAVAGAPEPVDSVEASCTLRAAQQAGSISQPTITYRALPQSAAEVTAVCFRSYDDAYAVIRASTDTGTVTVFGAGDALTNESVIEYGNAALALGVLGANETLIWYLPGYDDVAGGVAPTPGDLTPGWVTPVLLLLVLVVVAAGIWRGRRFGPVVVENLPVTVRASETMEGRARLYAKQAAFGRALDALRIGTIQRLTTALALPRHASVVEVSRAVAAITGRHVNEVHDTLVGAVPQSEAELLALSDRLLVLEQDVHRATDPR